jgi:hypothetical protein
MKWDFYTVYVDHPITHAKYLFESYANDEVEVLEWDVNEQRHIQSVVLKPEELNAESFYGIYYFKGNELKFKSLKELSFFKFHFFKISSIIRNLRQNVSTFLYKRKKIQIANRMLVLDSIIELYLAGERNKKVSLFELVSVIHGDLWASRDDTSRMFKELRLALESFITNGDIIKHDNDYYSPTGKSFLTQSEYLESRLRHNESASIQRRMLWIAVFSCIAAIASAIAALKQIHLIP